jgi:TPP-dependent 2-oxoacid decarboxylase
LDFSPTNCPLPPIHLNSTDVDTADKNYQGVYIGELLQSIADSSSGIVDGETAGSSVEAADLRSVKRSPHPRRILEGDTGFLRPGDVIVVEDGASSAGMGRLTLPDACTYITGAYVWCSIGYATGALLGAILATPGRRHILLTGEGSCR